jgi:hypothetical protein
MNEVKMIEGTLCTRSRTRKAAFDLAGEKLAVLESVWSTSGQDTA